MTTNQNETATNAILAIACGPIVTTWDTRSNNGVDGNNDNGKDETSRRSSSSSCSKMIHATSMLHEVVLRKTHDMAPSKLELESMGICQFQPFDHYDHHINADYNELEDSKNNINSNLNSNSNYSIHRMKSMDGRIVNDIAWNHNGQVLASCSNLSSSSSPNEAQNNTDLHNVVLTVYNTQTKLESFSNFDFTHHHHHCTTSISFGGKNAKSRYVCVSDEGGYVSIWDMKKEPAKRVRKFRLQNHSQQQHSNNNNHNMNERPACAKASMDRTDTFVIGLHGQGGGHYPYNGQTNNNNNFTTLDLFHLKKGGIVSTFQDNGSHGGASNCFHSSNIDSNQLLVGTRDGSLLLWDLSSSISTTTTSSTTSYTSPIACLDKRHQDMITDVEFSPMNKVLAASCSLDGTIVFHDVHSHKKIQTLKPFTQSIPSSNNRIGDNCGLTALAFHSNGYTWAVGTDNGYVMNYDLRQISSGPLSTINVGDLVNNESSHRILSSYPVNKLEFAPIATSSRTPRTMKKKTNNMNEDVTSPPTVSVEHSKTLSTRTSVPNEEKKITVDNGDKFYSPQATSSSSNVVKELFQSDEKSCNVIHNMQNNYNEEQEYKSQEQTSTSIENDIVLDQNSTNEVEAKSEEISVEEITTDTDQIIKSFDKLYERVKLGEASFESTNVDEGSNKSLQESHMNERGDLVIITKGEIQEMIEDAVEALRDDMDEALQRIQFDFMKQLQKQADETTSLFEKQEKEIEKLRSENLSLKMKKDDINEIRLF